MIVFRVARSTYAGDLSGKGAELAGGRWNSRGVAMVYTSDSRALCTAEVAVHLPLGLVPRDFQIITIDVPDLEIKALEMPALPDDWNRFPWPASTQGIGDHFIEMGNTAGLKVPSAVVQGDFNVLLNPGHPNMKHVRILEIQPFTFDDRLFRRT